MGLAEYKRKRNFKKTSEPVGGKASLKDPIFVVQEHWASHLHYDFRLEAFGVLKSWAVPKGPSTAVGDKRLAVETEDHPMDYAQFEGEIPEGEYGAGTMKIWDKGTWVPPKNLKEQLKKGRIEFELRGKKLKGLWLLQRSKHGKQWLLIKRHDKKTSDSVQIEIPNKRKSPDPWPETISPQLAQLMDEVPSSDRFIHEIKFDGYRTIAMKKNKAVALLTRSGLDWTEKYVPLDEEIAKLSVTSAILDGEIVVLDDQGRSDFSALQEAIKTGTMDRSVYYAFDLLYVNGKDIREEPLEIRKQILKKILKLSKSKKILYSEHVRGQGVELFAEASDKGLEGIISKDRTQAYSSGRSSAWQKIKTSKRQELVIGGYTDPEGSRIGLGSLLMGVYDNEKLRYVGKVGTGFTQSKLKEIMPLLRKIETKNSPFEIQSPRNSSRIHWVQPKLVAEVEFKAWTADHILRHASFQGLRSDKKALEVVEEKPQHLGAAQSTSKPRSGFKISHPERVVYPSSETRKIDVANYYKTIAPWLLAHVADRPLSLVRCPNQAGSHCFFQKHVETSAVTAIRETLIRDQKVVSIDSEEGLLQLVQWGVLEPHTWQTRIEYSQFPDQVIFDLDPDGAVKWKEVVETSLRLKDLLERLDLESFVKTTGGKGLHIHVPIAPLYSWDKVKSFSKTVSQQLEAEYPGKYTTNILKKNRKNKIFIDYLRNGFGATAIAPFSLRSRTHPTTAVPIGWDELKKLKSGADFDLHTTLQRLAKQKKDPWKGYFKMRQRIGILKPDGSNQSTTGL